MMHVALNIFVDYNTPTMRGVCGLYIPTLMCLLVSYVNMHVPM